MLKADFDGISDAESAAVVTDLGKFNEVIRSAAEKYEPCYVARYLVELCKDFNRFYLANRIVNEPDGIKYARAALTEAVGTVIEEGLRILGVETPEKM